MMTSSNPLRNILGERPLPSRLTHAEEIALANRVAAGQVAERRSHRRALTPRRRRALRAAMADAQMAREALVLHNLPLVLSIAGRFRHAELSYDDLIQEGILGLLKAADRYNPERGTRFGTLAVWWIRQAIGRAIANTGRTIRLPVNRAWKLSQLRRITAQLAQQSGDEPAVETVAERAGVTAEAAIGLLRDGQSVVSLDAPVDPDDRAALERIADNTVADPEGAVVTGSLHAVLEESLARLDEREAQILKLRFGLGGGEARPLRAIAAEWRMSPEGVRQISERAMTHLRAMTRVRDLSVYLTE
ncbi:MAG: sigma-70 family RNA polymerase sigma factor [Anaerolineales bacterium]|nr:sigma-70 family RNA polymerase sigma factor [Anaerolineales bacterium]